MDGEGGWDRYGIMRREREGGGMRHACSKISMHVLSFNVI